MSRQVSQLIEDNVSLSNAGLTNDGGQHIVSSAVGSFRDRLAMRQGLEFKYDESRMIEEF